MLHLLLQPEIFVVVIVDGDGDNSLIAASFKQAADGSAINTQFARNLRLRHILFVIELGNLHNQTDIVTVFHCRLLVLHICANTLSHRLI
ncbi:hypothetical protein ExPUPEC61_00478 [Escherichia coli]|nr:hypothetical protein ExPUPEC61_00478 [Escherichia coli]